MAVDLKLLEKDGFVFRKINHGQFCMGHIKNDLNAKEIETIHNVIISSPFYVLKTPVTVGQYRKFVNAQNIDTSYIIEKWDGTDWVKGPYFDEINVENDYPVVGVSYFDALSFIRWISEKYQMLFRLPTEAEFEFAARGGCNCIGKCKYAEIARERHLDRREDEAPMAKAYPVKQMIENNYGLLGMHCSIWQWCSDWFFYYSNEVVDPKGLKKEPEYAPWKGEKWKSGKVIRGGSFSYPYYHSRCSNRHYALTTDRNYNVGFRIVFNE